MPSHKYTLHGMRSTTSYIIFIIAVAYKSCWLTHLLLAFRYFTILHLPYLLILMVSVYHSFDHKFMTSHVVISHVNGITSRTVHLALLLVAVQLPKYYHSNALHPPKINPSKILHYMVLCFSACVMMPYEVPFGT